MIITRSCNRAQNNLDIILMPEGPRGMASRTKGGPLTCYTRQDIIMAACLCSSQASSQSTRNLLVIFCYSLRLSYSPWTRVLHGCKWRCKELALLPNSKVRKVSLISRQPSWCRWEEVILQKPDLKFYLWEGGDPDTWWFFWVPAPSVISGYLCGTLLIIRGNARISLGYAVCRAAVCCHDNPLICNVGISRLRLSTCLPCQGSGLARWIVISEAIFWQRLHFARTLRLKGQSCATSIYCVWTQSLRSAALHFSLSLSVWQTHTRT